MSTRPDSSPRTPKPRTQRRSNGDGSVYRRADGRWDAKLTLPDGRVAKRTRRTKAEANAALRELRAEVDRGAYSASARTTVAEVAARWLDQRAHEVADGKLKTSTHAYYRQTLAYYVLPHVGGTPVAKLGLRDVERMLDALRADGLSARTRGAARGVLGQVMKRARREGLTAADPVSDTDAGRRDATSKVQEALSADEVRALLAEVDDRHALAVRLMVMTGVRVGEALGLCWDAVDIDAGTLTVRRNLVTVNTPRTDDGPGRSELVLGEPKTRSGRRTITLSPDLVARLRAHRKAQAAERLAVRGWGDGWAESFVFTSPTGEPMDRAALGKALAAAGKRAAVERRVSCHVLRHTAGTHARRNGASIAAVAALLGHSDPTITARFYDHALAEEPAEAAALLAETFG